MTTYLRKTDREILTDWYEDCLYDTGADEDEVPATLAWLSRLGNADFYRECIDFMPECMDDLSRYLHDHSNQGVLV